LTHEAKQDDTYQAAFSAKAAEKALAVALDVRKFEIDLYWKRAAYFWVFTGAALAGHLAALTEKDHHVRAQAMLLTSCVGFIFAFAWYLVNRASKFWQSKWEAHVDLLENEVNGPLYKTVLSDRTPWWKLNGAYQFSVSKINQMLSLYVVIVFLGLVANTGYSYYVFSRKWQIFPTACLLITGAAAVSLVKYGRTAVGDRSAFWRRRTTTARKWPTQ